MCIRDRLHLGDHLFEVSRVGDPAAVELGLAFAEPAAHGLAGDGTTPLVVGAVALWRVALAAATRVPARGVAQHDAALADEPDIGELGRQCPVGALIVLELAGHDTLDSSSSGPGSGNGQHLYCPLPVSTSRRRNTMTTMTTPEQFTLHSQNLGCLPIVNFFLNRMGLADHLRNYLPHGDARLRLTPAAVVEVVVRNLCLLYTSPSPRDRTRSRMPSSA